MRSIPRHSRQMLVMVAVVLLALFGVASGLAVSAHQNAGPRPERLTQERLTLPIATSRSVPTLPTLPPSPTAPTLPPVLTPEVAAGGSAEVSTPSGSARAHARARVAPSIPSARLRPTPPTLPALAAPTPRPPGHRPRPPASSTTSTTAPPLLCIPLVQACLQAGGQVDISLP